MAGHERILDRDENIDYRRASAAERMRGGFPGDPLTLYQGFPDVQRAILEEEAAAAEAALVAEEAEGIPGAIGTLTLAEAFPDTYVPQIERLAA